MSGVYIFAYGSFRYGYELHHLVKKHRFVGRGSYPYLKDP